MKTTRLLLATAIVAALLASACTNANNAANSSNATAAKTITDPELAPFLYGGVYFFQGYGNGTQTMMAMLDEEVDGKPGDADFLPQLHKAYTTYFYYPFKATDRSAAQSTLADAWGITDKASFQETQASLLAEGHQSDYERLSAPGAVPTDAEEEARIAFIQAHRSEVPAGGIKAWDFARYVNNTAMGFAAGYISQAEGNAALAKIPALARERYKSWEEYWNAYNLGRKYWAGDAASDAEFDRATADMQQGDYSIYKYMAF